uniref:NADH-ubiquinone oxidoreductase chain 2 n=1 Tax=Zelandoperla fenestrata TaxID=670197 RepID=A0A1X9ZER1_9NEOP|nr:NADH dehydrogenase subunit 2 [Zelandoperla fenestrata]ARS43772.1 NADH dehydrogenase subunit 2 [Zelandoperla fenestrata]
MFNNPTKLLFLLTLVSGTFLAISANSWFGAWIGLEINLLSFIPLMTNSKNLLSTEASLKYFLIQALASATLLMIVILSALIFSSPESLLINNEFMTTIISSTLMLKMGAAPFHFWFPGVMEGLNWLNGLTLMTWQKIAPLMLLSYNISMNIFTASIILLSVLIGSLGGFNQTSLRKILAYSSINHLGWMISALIMGENLMIFYFSIYSLLTFAMVMMFNNFKLFHLNQIFSLNYLSPVNKFAIFTTLLSLGGLPPFLGFLPKWLIIQNMAQEGYLVIITLMVMMTLITLFYYVRTSFGAFMLSYTETLWNSQQFHKNLSPLTLLLSIMSALGLGVCTIIFNIY